VATFRGSGGAAIVLDLDAMTPARRQGFDAQIESGALVSVDEAKPKAKAKAAPKPTTADDADSD
jgi:hypothetical protein